MALWLNCTFVLIRSNRQYQLVSRRKYCAHLDPPVVGCGDIPTARFHLPKDTCDSSALEILPNWLEVSTIRSAVVCDPKKCVYERCNGRYTLDEEGAGASVCVCVCARMRAIEKFTLVQRMLELKGIQGVTKPTKSVGRLEVKGQSFREPAIFGESKDLGK